MSAGLAGPPIKRLKQAVISFPVRSGPPGNIGRRPSDGTMSAGDHGDAMPPNEPTDPRPPVARYKMYWFVVVYF